MLKADWANTPEFVGTQRNSGSSLRDTLDLTYTAAMKSPRLQPAASLPALLVVSALYWPADAQTAASPYAQGPQGSSGPQGVYAPAYAPGYAPSYAPGWGWPSASPTNAPQRGPQSATQGTYSQQQQPYGSGQPYIPGQHYYPTTAPQQFDQGFYPGQGYPTGRPTYAPGQGQPAQHPAHPGSLYPNHPEMRPPHWTTEDPYSTNTTTEEPGFGSALADLLRAKVAALRSALLGGVRVVAGIPRLILDAVTPASTPPPPTPAYGM